MYPALAIFTLPGSAFVEDHHPSPCAPSTATAGSESCWRPGSAVQEGRGVERTSCPWPTTPRKALRGSVRRRLWHFRKDCKFDNIHASTVMTVDMWYKYYGVLFTLGTTYVKQECGWRMNWHVRRELQKWQQKSKSRGTQRKHVFAALFLMSCISLVPAEHTHTHDCD